MSTPEPLQRKRHLRVEKAGGCFDIHGWMCRIGIGLLVGFLVQALFEFHWPWLNDWQHDSFYKQLSGFVLVTYLAHQWHLAALRAKGWNRRAGQELSRHRFAGTLAPLILYLHTQDFGHGFQIVLVGTFLALTATGLLHTHLVRSRVSRWQGAWLVIHIVLAVLLTVLLGFHVYVSYAYR